jgi:hypothetical protein
MVDLKSYGGEKMFDVTGRGPARRLARGVLIALCVTVGTACWSQDDTKKPDDAKKVEEAKKADAGKFNLNIMGRKVGSCAFKFDAEGGSEASVDVELGGQSLKYKVNVKRKAGKLVGFGTDAGASNRFTAVVEGEKANVTVNDAAPISRPFPAGSLPFGNFSPHMMNYLLDAYDSKKPGTPAETPSKPAESKPAAQVVTLFLVEGLPDGNLMTMKGRLTASRAKEMKVAGKPLTVSVYDLILLAGGQEIEVKLYANAEKRLLAWDVLSQNYMAVREGYEEVLKAGGK